LDEDDEISDLIPIILSIKKLQLLTQISTWH